jgi:hypothetical protein
VTNPRSHRDHDHVDVLRDHAAENFLRPHEALTDVASPLLPDATRTGAITPSGHPRARRPVSSFRPAGSADHHTTSAPASRDAGATERTKEATP